jgi:hypothetical protein
MEVVRSSETSGFFKKYDVRTQNVVLLVYTGFLLGIFFDPEDGVDIFLLNVLLQPRGPSSPFLLVSFLAYSSTLKMEAISSSVTFFSLRTTPCYSAEGRTPHLWWLLASLIL